MKKITTSSYKKLSRMQSSSSNVEKSIMNLDLPEKVIGAILTALRECQDSYCQTYIKAMPEAILFGKQRNQLEEAVKTQLHYIYANMEEYNNEEVKNIIADHLQIPPEDRHGAPLDTEENIGTNY